MSKPVLFILVPLIHNKKRGVMEERWKSYSSQAIIEEVNRVKDMHYQARTSFIALSNRKDGKRVITQIPTNLKSNKVKLTFEFEHPIDEETRKEINELARFMNQNVIIRLASILDYYGIAKGEKTLHKELKGYDHLWVLIKLRQKYAHSNGKYNPSSKHGKDNRRLMHFMIEKYNLNRDPSEQTEYPLLKRQVIGTMILGIKQYVEAFYRMHGKE